MFEQSAFDLHGTHPHAFDLHHVVGAANVPVIAVGIAIVLVSGAQPMALDGLFRLLVLVPVAGADRITLDQQIPDFAVENRLSIFVDDARLIAFEDLSARAWPGCAWPIGDEHVQSFGRADGIEYLDSKLFFEAVKQPRRQSFAGRDAMAHPRER